MSDLLDVPITYITDFDEVEEFLRWLGERRFCLGFDLETTGLRYWRPEFRIRLAQFGDANRAWVFRVDRYGALLEHVMSQYKERISGHNIIGFDFHCLASQGFALPDPRNVHDTLISSKLTQANQYDHSLKGNGVRHFGSVAKFGQDMLHEAFSQLGLREDSRNTAESEYAWTNIPYDCDAYTLYSGLDTVLVARLDEKLWPEVCSSFAEPYEREIASWFVTGKTERKGLRVDLDYTNKYHDEISQQIDVVRNQLAHLGLPNPGSRATLAKKLIDDGWEPADFSKKTGAPTTKKAVIENLDFEVIGPLMEWNRLTKWRTTYVESILNCAYNGRVFPSINHMGAKTGRQSAYGPPIHQMPSRHDDAWKIRRMFLPEEGEQWVSIDYQAQENRLLAHFSGDQLLTKIITEGLDIHIYNAAAIFDVPIGSVTPEQRAISKTYSYASGYGAQDLKLSTVLGCNVSDMPAIRQRVAGAFSGVAAYSEVLEQSALDQFQREGSAYVTTWGGRRVYIDSKYGRLQTTQVVNYPNQGSGADILKDAQNKIAAAGLEDHIALTLHDEFGISVPRGKDGEDIAHEISRLMEFRTEFKVPMLTSTGSQTDYWGEH